MSKVDNRFNNVCCDIHRCQLAVLAKSLRELNVDTHVEQSKKKNSHKYIINAEIYVTTLIKLCITHTDKYSDEGEFIRCTSTSTFSTYIDVPKTVCVDYIVSHENVNKILYDVARAARYGTDVVVPINKYVPTIIEAKKVIEKQYLPGIAGVYAKHVDAYGASNAKHSSW